MRAGIFFKIRHNFFLEQFEVHSKIEGEGSDFPYTPRTSSAFPVNSSPHRSCACVTVAGPLQTHGHQSLYVRLTLGGIHSVGLDKRIMTCIEPSLWCHAELCLLP